MRLLVTRLRFLGDIVLSTPLLEVLRERYPDSTIEYLAAAPFAEVLQGHPALDRVHVLPARPRAHDLWGAVRALREGPPIDWVFDLFSNPRSALIVALSGARERVGSARGLRSRVYQHRRTRPEGDRSAIRHHLDKLVPLLGAAPPPRRPRITVDPGLARQVLDREALTAGSYALVHPGSTWPEKAWPHERWPELLRGLDRGRCGEPVVVAPPGEIGRARELAEASRARRLPELPLSELAAVVQGARLYVGNDGGVMHMAVALGVPTVALFGPTEPDIWFPYEEFGPFRVLHDCGPERRDASGNQLSRLQGITTEAVLETVEDVLARAGERGS